MIRSQPGVSSMNDADTTVGDLKDRAREFRDKREWRRFHTPKNLSMAIAVEAAELMEEFQWLTPDEVWKLAEDESSLQRLGEELADVLIYALSLADCLELDVTAAVLAKLRRNAEKYPEDEYLGMSSWLGLDNRSDP